MAIDVETLGGVSATTLNGSITSGDTSITLTDGTGYPTGSNGDFYIVIDEGLSTQEVVKIASRTSNTLTVAASGRGADGSSAQSHDDGAAVAHVASAETIQAVIDHADATTGTPHGSAYLTSSDNAATATALETARTLSLTGDVTGTSGAFDGSGNFSLASTIASAAVTNAKASFSWSSFTPVFEQGVPLTLSADLAVYMEIGELGLAVGQVTFSSAGTAGDVKMTVPGSGLQTSFAHAGGTFLFVDASGTDSHTGHIRGESQATDLVDFFVSDGRQLGAALNPESDGSAVASGDVLHFVLLYNAG